LHSGRFEAYRIWAGVGKKKTYARFFSGRSVIFKDGGEEMFRITPPSKDDLRREKRVNELKKEYREKHIDPKNAELIDDLDFALSRLIGINNLKLLREFRELLIAQHDTAPEWFYEKGYEDGLADGRNKSL